MYAEFLIAIDTTFGKVLGSVCGNRSISTSRKLFQHFMDLRYGTDCLRDYKYLISVLSLSIGSALAQKISL